jgi:hypothetical protein
MEKRMRKKTRKKLDRSSLIESITDTLLGLTINFPLSWLVVYLVLLFTDSAFVITAWTTGVLTATAIIRRYLTRVYFKKHETR